VFFVPAHAVLEDESGRFVYVVESVSGGRGEVQRRTVETGDLSQLGLEIRSGLASGDRVVTAGMSKMRPGLPVRLATDSAP
jgi:membrane fusion protein (multidrug efflux system)